MIEKVGFVYIMTNKRDTVFYTGMTNDLIRRVKEHQEKLIKGFTRIYNINKLVYYEVHERVEDAIIREKQIKGGSRQDKINLIKKMNPAFKNLSDQLNFDW